MRRLPSRSTLASSRGSSLIGDLRRVVMAGCLLGSLGVGPAWAEPAPDTPAPAGDRVAQFLGEQGLIPGAASEPSKARQFRERAADWTSDLVLSAMNFLGVRYRLGGNSADEGFDCSGFTRHVFEASIGLVLPRRSNEQAKAATLQPVKLEQLKPGDLVFFNTLRTAFSHVGIYVGDGKFIHAPRTGGQVRVEDMRIAYWSKRFNGARRASAPGAASNADSLGPASLRPQAGAPTEGNATVAPTTPRHAESGVNATPTPGIVY